MASDGVFSAVRFDRPASTSGSRPVRIPVAGELGVQSAPALHEAVLAALAAGPPALLELDFGGVTFLDSSGIRALLQCHADAERAGCRLTVVGPGHGVRRVLEITGLLEHLGLA